MTDGVSRFDCFPSDFLNGIIGLSPDEITTYTVVLMLQYDRGQPVAWVGRERELSTRCGRMSITRITKAVDGLIAAGKLSLVDGSLENPRAASELKKIRARISKNRENSAEGGNRTREKWKGKPSGNNDGPGPNGRPVGLASLGPVPQPPSPSPQPPIHTTPDSASADASVDANAADPPDRLPPIDPDSLEASLVRAVTEGGGTLNYATRPALFDLSPIVGLIDAGFDLETEILPIVRARSSGRDVRSWGYFVEAVHEARDRRAAAGRQRPALRVVGGGSVRDGPAQRRALPRDPVLQAREELLLERAAQQEF